MKLQRLFLFLCMLTVCHVKAMDNPGFVENSNTTELFRVLSDCSSFLLVEEIEDLIKNGANVMAVDSYHRTSLHWAAWKQQDPKIIKVLVEATGTKTFNCWCFRKVVVDISYLSAVDNGRRTALHYAAGYNFNPDITKTLIKAGADVNAQDNYDWTPLHYASALNFPQVVKLLVDNGADLEARDRDGKTPGDLVVRNKNPFIRDQILSILGRVGKI